MNTEFISFNLILFLLFSNNNFAAQLEEGKNSLDVSSNAGKPQVRLPGKFHEDIWGEKENIEPIYREESLDAEAVCEFFYQTLSSKIIKNTHAKLSSSSPKPIGDIEKLFISPIVFKKDFKNLIYKIYKDIELDPSAWLAVLINIDKFTAKENIQLNLHNFRAIMAIALLVTHKNESEIRLINKEFARYFNTNLQYVNRLEVVFWRSFEWNLTIKPEEYKRYEDKFRKYLTKKSKA